MMGRDLDFKIALDECLGRQCSFMLISGMQVKSYILEVGSDCVKLGNRKDGAGGWGWWKINALLNFGPIDDELIL